MNSFRLSRQHRCRLSKPVAIRFVCRTVNCRYFFGRHENCFWKISFDISLVFPCTPSGGTVKRRSIVLGVFVACRVDLCGNFLAYLNDIAVRGVLSTCCAESMVEVTSCTGKHIPTRIVPRMGELAARIHNTKGGRCPQICSGLSSMVPSAFRQVRRQASCFESETVSRFSQQALKAVAIRACSWARCVDLVFGRSSCVSPCFRGNQPSDYSVAI